MNLEDYFEPIAPDNIRIKGHRIGIETIIESFLNGCEPSEIAIEYPGLALETIYATITYYLHNRSELDTYLMHLHREKEAEYQKARQNPPLIVQRMIDIKAERKKQHLQLSSQSEINRGL
ncbi:DUF433 domain-containing protein [Spirulina sp. 06S082]|uniref:DUF433 domain-containing protein n=1 Tax=Spirulina sp. 06S082 TaxID=3110248 RepID=UPI002B20C793|nr:DUF433 domain-containing protein [Spirulina sp. 06S082]MEA5469617.1 DUF433 domain-containing protein [Spirulina sp. 06S082]